MQIGVAYGSALTVGSFLGETAGGWVVDYVIVGTVYRMRLSLSLITNLHRIRCIKERARRRHGEDAPSEVRLMAVWTGQLLVPVHMTIATDYEYLLTARRERPYTRRAFLSTASVYSSALHGQGPSSEWVSRASVYSVLPPLC